MNKIVKSDLEIAALTTMKPISEVAGKLGLVSTDLFNYGDFMAKITNQPTADRKGKLILVTAISPTKAGEGKTTITIGLGQALNKIGKDATVALREPSFGPTLGLKGGAAGGGYSQVMPMEEINLHFTGDIHAITTANNTIAAMIDSHIFHGNELRFDINNITWKRAMDINDRALREITIGLGDNNGMVRQDGFYLSVASEIMAILCLADNQTDLEERVSQVIVGYNQSGEPIKVKELNIQGAISLILKDAMKPNLVQTVENTPAIIHGGPFANIAHGCNSVIATKMALATSEYVVTEAGFGSDLGAEKFINIKCRKADLAPDAIVLVATIRALKMHGGLSQEELTSPNLSALKQGIANLEGHIANLKNYGVPVVVTINHFITDTSEEVKILKDYLEQARIPFAVTNVWEKGGDGGIELAKIITEVSTQNSKLQFTYNDEDSIEEKINLVSKKVYGASGVQFSNEAITQMNQLEKLGFSNLPICMAKTPVSFSDNPTLLGRPKDFNINVTGIYVQSGAGFIVVKTGEIMMMPGLGKEPAVQKMQLTSDGKAIGLF